MSIDQIAPEALRLPPRERAQLAASLWESIEDPYVLAADRSDEDALSSTLFFARSLVAVKWPRCAGNGEFDPAAWQSGIRITVSR